MEFLGYTVRQESWQLFFESYQLIIAIFVFVFGVIIGSSLNALIFRLKNNKNFFSGRSMCVHCEKQLSWQELIPLFSFLIQNGTCKKCKKSIPKSYFFVEFFTGILFMHSLFVFSELHQIIFSWIVITLSVLIFVYDLKYMLIEDRVSIPFMGVILVFLAFHPEYAIQHILTGLGVALFFIIQILVTKGKGVGGGDIRLGFIMGLLLGWPMALYALMTSYMIALIWILPLLLVKKVSMKSRIPLGPFLIIGMLLFFFHGKFLVEYINNFLVITA